MKLTYIFHSGFVLETEHTMLVFDYWLDPSGVMEDVLRKQKPIYVFSSHFHEDHFTRDIFDWKRQKSDITYILSKDISVPLKWDTNEMVLMFGETQISLPQINIMITYA